MTSRPADFGIYSRGALALAVLLPLAALSVRGGSTLVFYSLVALSLAAAVDIRLRGSGGTGLRVAAPVACALALPLASTLLTAWSVAALPGSELEKSLRFLLAALLFVPLSMARPEWLRHMQWGLLAGSCSGSIVILCGVWSGQGRDLTDLGANYNAVTLANLTMLLGTAGLLTTPWTLTARPRIERGLKIAVFVLALCAVHLSETRSSWMLLPVLALVFVCGARQPLRTRIAMAAACAALLAALAVLLYFSNPRFALIAQETLLFLDGRLRDTSVGLRLQLWHASLEMFLQNPWLGIGPDNFRPALQALAREGVLTTYAATNFGEPHNDFLAALACNGVVGLLAILGLYGLPAWWFSRRIRDADRTVRVAARIGLLLCLGYAAFSLTEMMFRAMRSVPLYSVSMVLLASLARNAGTRARKDATVPA